VGAFLCLLRNHQIPRAAAVTAIAVLLVGDTVMQAITEIKGDLLPLVFALWALVFLTGAARDRPRTLQVAALLLACAVLSKPTSLMYTAAVVLWLVLRRRYAAALLVASMVTVWAGAGLLAVDWWSNHSFWRSIHQFAGAGGAWTTVFLGLPNFLHDTYSPTDPAMICFFTVALLCAATLYRKPDALLRWVFCAVLCGTVLIMGSPGAARNHLIDLYVISIIIVFATIYDGTRLRQIVATRLATAVAVVGGVALVLHPLVGNARETAWARKQVLVVLELAGAYDQGRPPVLCFDPVIDAEAGRSAYVLDSMMLHIYLTSHPDAELRFIAKIRAGFFPFMVLSVPFNESGTADVNALAPQIGSAGVQAAAERYQLVLRAGIYRVYRVRSDLPR
jgi:hypothetical protein